MKDRTLLVTAVVTAVLGLVGMAMAFDGPPGPPNPLTPKKCSALSACGEVLCGKAITCVCETDNGINNCNPVLS
jgi:hypothetical protein